MATRASFGGDFPFQGEAAAAATLPEIASPIRVESVRARLASLATCLHGLGVRRINAKRRLRDTGYATPKPDDASIYVWNWKIVGARLHHKALIMIVPGDIDTKPPGQKLVSIVRLQLRGWYVPIMLDGRTALVVWHRCTEGPTKMP